MANQWVVVAHSRNRVDVQVFAAKSGSPFTTETQAARTATLLRSRYLTLTFTVQFLTPYAVMEKERPRRPNHWDSERFTG